MGTPSISCSSNASATAGHNNRVRLISNVWVVFTLGAYRVAVYGHTLQQLLIKCQRNCTGATNKTSEGDSLEALAVMGGECTVFWLFPCQALLRCSQG
jgi:hypothetical protein